MLLLSREMCFIFFRVTSPFGAFWGTFCGNGCMLFCVCRVEESQRTPAVIEFLFFFPSSFFFVRRTKPQKARSLMVQREEEEKISDNGKFRRRAHKR